MILTDLINSLRAITKGQEKKVWEVQLLQHLITGGIATLAHYLVMLFFLKLHTPPLVATSCGFVAGATTRFMFSYYHIFEPESHVAGVVARFLVLLGLQMAFNAGLLALFLAVNISVWPAQIITTVLLIVVNFLLAKFWVFK